jgi:hypothetical protein
MMGGVSGWLAIQVDLMTVILIFTIIVTCLLFKDKIGDTIIIAMIF